MDGVIHEHELQTMHTLNLESGLTWRKALEHKQLAYLKFAKTGQIIRWIWIISQYYNCHIKNFAIPGFFFAQKGFRLIGFSLKQVVTFKKFLKTKLFNWKPT